LNLNRTQSLIIKAQANKLGEITNIVKLITPPPPYNVGNNESNVTVNVHPINITINKTVNNDHPYLGDNVKFTIMINQVDGNVDNLLVNETLPDGLIYISDNSNGKYNFSTEVWNVTGLNSNKMQSLIIEAKVDKLGEITNIANIITPPPKNIGNNQSAVKINVKSEGDNGNSGLPKTAIPIIIVLLIAIVGTYLYRKK
jgi:uncharacterized repeat protein (TIGR01451 family)